MKQYKKKNGQTVFALPLALAEAQLSYRKWGGQQQAAEGDWLVYADEESYTVNKESFGQTYMASGEHRYQKKHSVWAEVAEQDGSIATKEGTTQYRSGDMLVYNNADRSDGYAISREAFLKRYQAVDDSFEGLKTGRVMMQAKDYLEQRLNNQIQWYEKKSAYNQRRFKQCQLWAIILGAAIPLLTAVSFAELENLLRFTVALLGSLVAILNAILALYKFQENWVQYRNAAESLIREKFLFLTQASPYDEDREAERFTLLVERCEGIMSSEQIKWYKQVANKPVATSKKPAAQAD